MTVRSKPSVYRFLAELLLYPEDRDSAKLKSFAEEAAEASPELGEAVGAMLANPKLACCDSYLETFEIGPKCPLYLGHYLFDEPNNCRGAAISGRNGYMIQLKGLYRHFGLELQGGELPDFLPLMLDFLAMTANHADQKRRRWMIQHYIQPALPAFAKGLREANNTYSPVAGILEQLIEEDVGEPPPAPTEPAAAAAQLRNAT